MAITAVPCHQTIGLELGPAAIGMNYEYPVHLGCVWSVDSLMLACAGACSAIAGPNGLRVGYGKCANARV
eukprot:scaffold195561_cov22-Prasinocladus_malaysianus.AAC.1